MGILLLADGGLQRDRLLGDLQNLPYLFHRHLQFLGGLLRAGVVAQLLQKLTLDADDFIDGLHHMHGDTDGAGLVRDGPGDGLADPPGGVGGKLKAFDIVEFLNRFDKAQIPFLNEVQKQQAASDIAFGDRDHQTQIGFRHAALGFLVALYHLLG